MRKQIRGLTQASTNAQDGISAVQTAEGALNEVQDMLQRMNELAVKAANGTNSSDDRSYIQDEIDQLVTEIDRVAETTKFNETYLLKGDENGTKKTKFAYKQTDVTTADLYYMKDGKVAKLAAGTAKTDLDSKVAYYTSDLSKKVGTQMASTDIQSVSINKLDNLYKKDASGNFTLVAKGEEIASNGDVYYTGTYVASNTLQDMGSIAASNATELHYNNTDVAYDSNGNKYDAGKLDIGTACADYSKYYGAVGNAQLMGDSIGYSNIQTKKGSTQFQDKDGNEIAANGLYRYLDQSGKILANADIRLADGTKATQDRVDLYVDATGKFSRGVLNLKLHVGADATDNNQIGIELEAMSAEELGVDKLKVDGNDDVNARDAIETIKEALQKVSTQRSALGATQNRLEHTIANLDNVVENTTSAESGIRDTDMASEMVKFSNNNILAQAGQAMLAQANQSNQGVLSLLG